MSERQVDSLNKTCQPDSMNMQVDDPKQKAILDAAWTAFASYGFRKTSMDDIARAAGMSRPALYLHYRSKNDIFRHLVGFYYATATESVRAALQGQADPRAALRAAFDAQGGEVMEAMLTSPHGLELLDTGHQTASDVAAEGEAELRRIYTEWLQGLAARGQLLTGDDPADMAEAICTALKGLKMAGHAYPDYLRQLHTLASLFGAALRGGAAPQRVHAV